MSYRSPQGQQLELQSQPSLQIHQLPHLNHLRILHLYLKHQLPRTRRNLHKQKRRDETNTLKTATTIMKIRQ